MAHPLNKDKNIPFIVEKALLFVEQKGNSHAPNWHISEYNTALGLQTEGIFRLSGNSNKIQELKKLIDKGQDVKFSEDIEPHVVAGLLKLYFRELPDPLFTFALYDNFIACHGTHF